MQKGCVESMFKLNTAEVNYVLANLNKSDDQLCKDLDITKKGDKELLLKYVEECRKKQQDVVLVVDPREAKAVVHEPLTREEELKLSENKRALLVDGIKIYDPNPKR